MTTEEPKHCLVFYRQTESHENVDRAGGPAAQISAGLYRRITDIPETPVILQFVTAGPVPCSPRCSSRRPAHLDTQRRKEERRHSRTDQPAR